MTKARLLYVLSPAKTLDMAAPASALSHSLPSMLSDAHALVTELRKLTLAKLKSLLGVSDAIAKLNYDRFRTFESVESDQKLTTNGIHKQAVLAFNGPAYQGLAAHELNEKDLAYAQNHLRILCGLYGVLRPLDLIQAYRLEMGKKFANARGKDLYAFWGDRIAQDLTTSFANVEGGGEKVLVNVASQEYFKSVATSAFNEEVKVIDCVFKDNGAIKSVYAKRARGLMCRYLIMNRVDSIAGIQAFDLEGYVFSEDESSDTTFVFHRTAAKQKEVLRQIQAKAKAAKERKMNKERQGDEEEDAGAQTAPVKQAKVRSKKEPSKVKTEATKVEEDRLRRSKRRRM